MLVKLMRGKESWLHPCTHVHATEVPENCAAVKSGLDTPGIRLELCPKGPMIRLPEDGDTAYVMNDGGDTIDTHRWPPVSRGGGRP